MMRGRETLLWKGRDEFPRKKYNEGNGHKNAKARCDRAGRARPRMDASESRVK